MLYLFKESRRSARGYTREEEKFLKYNRLVIHHLNANGGLHAYGLMAAEDGKIVKQSNAMRLMRGIDLTSTELADAALRLETLRVEWESDSHHTATGKEPHSVLLHGVGGQGKSILMSSLKSLFEQVLGDDRVYGRLEQDVYYDAMPPTETTNRVTKVSLFMVDDVCQNDDGDAFTKMIFTAYSSFKTELLVADPKKKGIRMHPDLIVLSTNKAKIPARNDQVATLRRLNAHYVVDAGVIYKATIGSNIEEVVVGDEITPNAFMLECIKGAISKITGALKISNQNRINVALADYVKRAKAKASQKGPYPELEKIDIFKM